MLLNAVTIVLVLVCAASVCFWVTSHRRTLWLGYEVLDGRGGTVMTEDGWIAISLCTRRHPGFPPASDCFPPKPYAGWIVACRPVRSDGTSLAAGRDGQLRSWPPRLATSVGGPGYSDTWSIDLPYWVVVAALAAVPFGRAAVRWMSGRKWASDRCPACGYDLRATPERCPECGAIPQSMRHVTQ
jgi:hypothetical protein